MLPQSVGVDSRSSARKVIRLFTFQQKPQSTFVRVRLGFRPYRVVDKVQNDVCEESIHELGSGEIRQRMGYAVLQPHRSGVLIDQFREFIECGSRY